MTLPHQRTLVAVDLGAQSCRVSLLRWSQGQPQIDVVHRFPNSPIESAAGLHWDIEQILNGVQTGLRLCGELAPEGIASIAVDGWAVDYVRLDSRGAALANPFCYRDARTEEAERRVHDILAPADLYALTGIQILRINTLYQLYADNLSGRPASTPWLLIPEYIAHCLGGRPVAEYTNATHTALVQLGTRSWSKTVFDRLGLDLSAAPQIVQSGAIVGAIQGQLAELPAFRQTKLIVAATHDTAAAVAAIPATGDEWAFISSGTWSLVGTVLETPCVNEAAREQNFTNLGGASGKICFLKNVNGMWLLRQCMNEWELADLRVEVPQLIAACENLPAPKALLDVDAPDLMLPGNALQKIDAQLTRLGHPPFERNSASIPLVANLIFHSLAARYTEVLESIRCVTGKSLLRLFVVGGGSQNQFLNRLTAQRTGLEVHLGSVESTTIGNFAVQLAALEHGASASPVSADSVAKFARLLSGCAFALSSGRETD